MTKKGTLRSTVIPWMMEMMTNSFPLNLVMIGNVVSAVVAPPTDMGANFPKYRTSRGAANKAISSRMMLDTKAIGPNSAPLYWVIKIEERE